MTTPTLTAADVARFLSEHPEFFIEHEDVFTQLAIPHPHQARAISLGERQVLSLRTRTRELERQLSGLIHHASGNERLAQLLTHWCAELLSEDDAQALPGRIVRGLAHHFSLPDIALRLWDLPQLTPDSPHGEAVSQAIVDAVCALSQPVCTPVDSQPVASLLTPSSLSMAVLPLRLATAASPCIGVLVLGSGEPGRFTSDMGTELLQLVGRLAGAALARLDDPALRAGPA
ncbi:MAG: DUF484 family protein [Castellaniella sp.]